MFSSLLNAISQHNDIKDEKYDLLKDDELYPNTGATKHHYDRNGVNYIASMNNKKFIETFLTGVRWKDQDNGDVISGNARTYAKIIIAHAQKIKKNNYELVISYKHAKQCKSGRLFDDGMGTQNLNKQLRTYFQPDTYHDYDMCNAHPTILLTLCHELKLNCERLEEYVSNRDQVLEMSGKTKKDILTMINCDKHRASTNNWVQGFCDELVRNKAKIVNIIANDYNSTENSKHPLSSKVNKLLCDIENRCLHAGMQAVEADEDTVLMFDGFMTQRELTTDEIGDMNTATELFGIKWCEKKWVKADVPDYTMQKERSYQAMKEQWEEKHFIVSEPQFSYWRENDDGPKPINRQACQDATRKMWYKNEDNKKCKLFDEWLDDDYARTYKRVEYIPHAKHDPPTLDDDVYNTAKPFVFDYIPKAERDPEAMVLFMKLLGELSEDDEGRDYMQRYFAHILQKPMERPEIMLLFKSHGGTGKDTLTKTLIRMLGHEHCTVVADMELLFGGFNSSIANKLFITMNEVDGKQGTKHIEKLKNSLTVDKIHIIYKNKDSYEQVNVARNLAFSNNPNPMPVDTASARRMLSNQVRADRQLPKEFFETYYKCLEDPEWINALASDLYDIDLTGFKIRQPPETASMRSKLQAKIQPLHKFLQGLCEGQHADVVFKHVPKEEGCIAIQVSDFNRLYKDRLTELYPSGWEPFMTDKKYLSNVFGNYNDIIYPNKRKSVNKAQKNVHIIHKERMIAGLKNRREYSLPDLDESDDEDIC